MTMDDKPIEITISDIIRRPGPGVPVPTKTPSQGFNPKDILKTVKDSVNELKGIQETLRSMGIDLKLPGTIGKALNQDKVQEKDVGGPSPAQQFQNFMALLQMKYGDITMAECLDKLRGEFGNVKLSQFRNFRP